MRGERSSTRAAGVAIPIGIAALGVVLGLYRLGAKPLASDEATSFFIARLEWEAFWESLSTSEANGSLFYALLWLWTDIGTSEFVVRLLPFFFGAAAVVVLYFLVERLFGRFYGLAAAVLLLANSLFIGNVQDLRSYSLSALLVTLTTFLFVQVVERPSWRIAAVYAVVGGLSLYAHFFAAWVLLAHALSLVFLRRERIPGRRLIAAYALTALLAIPIALFVLTQDEGQVDWIRDPTFTQVVKKLVLITGNGGRLLLGLYIVAVVAAAVGCALRPRARPAPDAAPDQPLVRGDRWAWSLALLWLIVPIAGALAISLVKPLFEARYLLVSLPPLALCAVLGISLIPWRVVAIGAWAALVALTAADLPDWYASEERRLWEDRAAFVEEAGRPDDGIIFYAPTIIRPFGYYAGYYVDDDETAPPQVIYPGKQWLGFSRTRFHPPLDAILAAVEERDRVWLVIGAANDRPRMREKEELIVALRQTCGRPGRPFPGLALFTGCSPGSDA